MYKYSGPSLWLKALGLSRHVAILPQSAHSTARWFGVPARMSNEDLSGREHVAMGCRDWPKVKTVT